MLFIYHGNHTLENRNFSGHLISIIVFLIFWQYLVMDTSNSVDMTTREWLYIDNTGQKGPVPANILLRLLEKGLGVYPSTMVWRVGMEVWKPISQV